jgi:excinuclease ABC subunit C
MNKIKIDYKNLPTKSGCYIFKNKNNKVIYIGKAKNLKKRVCSYFTKNKLDIKTSLLVEKIENIDYIITNNEIEALLLENNLIKKYNPKYNIDLKDSTTYSYLKLTSEKFPRLVIYRNNSKEIKNTKQKNNKECIFGPFVNSNYRKKIQNYINRYLKLRTCKKLPKKECIRYHLGYCLAPCINKNKEIEEKYLENINEIKKILNGKTKEVLEKLEKDLNIYKIKEDFENAIVLRDKINAIKYLNEKQITQRKKTYNEDIINYVEKDNKIYLILFNIDKGILLNKKEFIISKEELQNTKIEIENKNILDNFIIKYYSNNQIPKEIIIPKQLNKLTIDYLKKIKKENINTIVPKIAEKKKLLDLVEINIQETFFKKLNTLNNLKEKLKLKNIPYIMECFDISHLSGTNIVASMVQFKNGKPNKKNYRKYKLRTVLDNNDFASMKEIIERRYTRLKKENEKLPNLIIIDGGKGQLNIAKEVLEKLNIIDQVDLISIAKKEEEIYKIDDLFPIKLSKKSNELKLIQQIRDEAHRFAITYQKLLRNKDLKLKK